MDDILTTSLKIFSSGVVCGVTIFGLNYYVNRNGVRNFGNTAPTETPPQSRSNCIDTVDHCVPSTSNDVTESNQIEIESSHNHLMSGLMNEIQADPKAEFKQIQLHATPHIGRANALGCMNIGDIFKQLEIKQKISPGQYDVLEEILNNSGMRHYRVVELIEQVKEKIEKLKSEPPSLVESISSSYAGPASTTDGAADALEETVKDAVIFYADTARQEAIKFRNTVTQLTSPPATISLKEEVGLGNLTESRSWEEMIRTHRYVFILMTADMDAMTYFAGDSLLDHFIRTKQSRMVPIWYSSDRTGHPLSLSALPGQNYYLMSSSSPGLPEIYKSGFKNLIYKGRRTIQVNTSS